MRLDGKMLGGLLIGAAFVGTGVAAAGFGIQELGPRHADVLDVVPLTEVVHEPREVCEPAELRRGARATERCHTELEPRERLAGYEVRYRLGSTVATARTAAPPPARIPVVNGRPQFESELPRG